MSEIEIKTKVRKFDEDNPLISIIILNYNAGDLLIDCVDSIKKSNYKNFEIILIDNISKDNSQKKCKERFPDIKLIENSKNLGYCEGNNVGIRIAKGEFIVILNPDTIVDSNWLNELILALKKVGEGFYQPKILANTDHSILLSTGNETNIFGFGYSRSKGSKDTNQFNKIEVVGCASGTCLFTSSKVFEKIGLFDSFLFAYHDDLELCWRGLLQGIKSYYVPKSIIYHPIEGYSFKWSKLKFYLLERNRKYSIFTHYSKQTLLKMIPSLVLVDLAVTIFYLKKRMILEKIKADLSIIKNLNFIFKKNSQIQKERILKDDEIIKSFKDHIEVPKWVIDEESNQSFNKFLRKIAKFTRNQIN